MVLGLSAVSATLVAALIGGATGIVGGLVGQVAAARLDRKAKREDRQLDDLIALQNVLARVNRLHHRVAGSQVQQQLGESIRARLA
jgi:hypothetical protein